MTKRVFISFTILFTVVVCTALDCKKWTLNGEVMSSVSVNVNDELYSGKAMFRPIGGWSGRIDASHRNDSSFFNILLPRLYNAEGDADFDLNFYIVEPTNTPRPQNGKIYELKKDLTTNTQDRWYLIDWKLTESGVFTDLDKTYGTMTIRDGWLEYREEELNNNYVRVNCNFSAVLESEKGNVFTLSDGKIYFYRIIKNPSDLSLQ